MEAPPVQYARTADGRSIAYALCGTGQPLVFLPLGLNHIQLAWQHDGRVSGWLQALSQRFRLVQYDGRATGMSERGLDDSHSLADLEPPGFLVIDGGQGRLSWPEYVGDGMFKTAGNIRGTGAASLLVFDLATGDAAELAGVATYQTLRTAKEAREDALQQHRDPFPVQGQMELTITEARRLTGVSHPRGRVKTVEKLTSCSPIDEQYPR